MDAVFAIAARELRSSFERAQGYVILVVFLLLVGQLTLVVDDLWAAGVASMRGPLSWMALALVFLAPAATMHLIAEEERSGRLAMLSTLPITAGQLVVGKWLSAVGVVTLGLVLTLPWPVAMALHGDLDWGPVVGGYLGVWAMGAGYAGIGVAASALSRNQVVAFLVALILCALPWWIGFAMPLITGEQAAVLQLFTADYHLANLTRGLVDTRSLVFFAGVIIVSLRLAVALLHHRRLAR